MAYQRLQLTKAKRFKFKLRWNITVRWDLQKFGFKNDEIWRIWDFEKQTLKIQNNKFYKLSQNAQNYIIQNQKT